jgi:hypothetical protein
MISKSNEPFVGFAGLKEFHEIKAELRKLSGSDKAYYDRLAQFQLEHSNQITNDAVLRQLREALQQELNYWRWEAVPGAPVAEAAPPKPTKRVIPFTAGEQLAELKRHLNWLTGSDSLFTSVMSKYGFAAIEDIKDRNAGYPVLRELSAERNRLQMERGMGHCDDELQDLLQRALYKLDHRFWTVLGQFQCGYMQQVFQLDSDALQRLLGRLKFECEQKDKQQGEL